MIINISPSPLKTKRFRVLYKHGDEKEKHFDFGLKGGYTYLDGADDKARDAYRKRHLASPNEGKLIRGLVPSPATFSYYLTWGDSRNIQTNIRTFNKLCMERLS
jgi:hypothetical protein